jgi:very-short-patch-repair endonuclease
MPLIGSEALASGVVSRHQLRTQYRALFPNVYLPKQAKPSLEQRIVAAWLWSHREATIAGTAAAALHGSEWIDDDICIELIYPNPHSPPGVLTRRDVLLDGEITTVGDLTVTTLKRTAFDIGRRQPRRAAVARLDTLLRATAVKVEDVLALADRHRGARGLRRLETALTLVDGFPIAYLDMGWPDLMVGVEYDGDHHRVERFQYVKDIRRLEALERMGWLIIRVVAEDRPADIARRVRHALGARRSSVR